MAEPTPQEFPDDIQSLLDEAAAPQRRAIADAAQHESQTIKDNRVSDASILRDFIAMRLEADLKVLRDESPPLKQMEKEEHAMRVDVKEDKGQTGDPHD